MGTSRSPIGWTVSRTSVVTEKYKMAMLQALKAMVDHWQSTSPGLVYPTLRAVSENAHKSSLLAQIQTMIRCRELVLAHLTRSKLALSPRTNLERVIHKLWIINGPFVTRTWSAAGKGILQVAILKLRMDNCSMLRWRHLRALDSNNKWTLQDSTRCLWSLCTRACRQGDCRVEVRRKATVYTSKLFTTMGLAT